MKRNRIAIWLLYTVAAGFAANAQDAAIQSIFVKKTVDSVTFETKSGDIYRESDPNFTRLVPNPALSGKVAINALIHGSEKNLVANFDASKSYYLGDNASGEFVLAEITPPAEDPTKAIVVEGSMTFYRSTLMLGYEIAPDKWSSEPMKGVLGTKDELRIGQSWEEGVVLKYKWRKGETRPALRFFDVPAGDYVIMTSFAGKKPEMNLDKFGDPSTTAFPGGTFLVIDNEDPSSGSNRRYNVEVIKRIDLTPKR